MPTDLGRDVPSVHALTRKHDAFCSELAALDPSLQALLAEGVRLASAYPGGNAEHLQQQQAVLKEAYTTVRERGEHRRTALAAAMEWQKFAANVGFFGNF
jgi:spectrin beta